MTFVAVERIASCSGGRLAARSRDDAHQLFVGPEGIELD